MTSFTKSYLKFMAILVLSMTAAIQVAKADFSNAERTELNALFEAYIKANPEVVREALIALAEREVMERREAGFSLVKSDAGDPFMGAGETADITIYEFSDYNCGYCKRVFGELQKVLAADDKVRLTLKEYPILAQSSVEAARAAIAAHMQGKFEAFHIGMMTWRGSVSLDSIMEVARNAGLDTTRLQADMGLPEVDAIIARTRTAAEAMEVSGTPALVIGKQMIPGAISAEEILTIIAQEREKGNS